MSVRITVLSMFSQVAEEQSKSLVELSDELDLMDSGLDSLCLAIIVARLEGELGADPFSRGDEMEMPVTVGDFVRLYEHAAT
jgi:acyl carrier protein